MLLGRMKMAAKVIIKRIKGAGLTVCVRFTVMRTSKTPN